MEAQDKNGRSGLVPVTFLKVTRHYFSSLIHNYIDLFVCFVVDTSL